MSISYLLDARLKLIRSTFVGVITLVDLVAYVRSLAAEDLLQHPQLIDARKATLRLTEWEIREIADLMTSLRTMFGRAPVGFVAGNAASRRIVQRYREMGAGSTRFEVFEDMAAAEVWLAAGGGRD